MPPGTIKGNGAIPDDLNLVEQLLATLHQRLFELFEEIEEAVRHGLVSQGRRPLRRL